MNVRADEYDVYIGRPSIFGNPFKIGRDGSREEVVEQYNEYFHERIESDPEFRKRVLALKGKRLGCYCKPLSCHGHIIVEYLEGCQSTSEG